MYPKERSPRFHCLAAIPKGCAFLDTTNSSSSLILYSLSFTLYLFPFFVSLAHAQPTSTRPAQAAPAIQPAGGTTLPGFMVATYLDEQIKQYRVEPGVNVLVNAPAAARFKPNRLTRVIFYTLPNGNTTAQTVGRQMTSPRATGGSPASAPEPRATNGLSASAPTIDWHFDIQHIGAQTRVLREGIPDDNIVVVYLEADGKSWPAWKAKHPDFREIIPRVIDSVRKLFEPSRCVYEWSGHSGGGSLIFGVIDTFEHIPADIRRIVFLDANYGYSEASGHAAKLTEWLKAAPDRCLSVICYDDRDVTLNGKPIVSPTGGTYRRTLEMAETLGKQLKLERTVEGDLLRYRGLDGRIDLILHQNPQRKILHTVLIGEMNGFIHAMTVGTPQENKLAPFGPPRVYTRFIQPE